MGLSDFMKKVGLVEDEKTDQSKLPAVKQEAPKMPQTQPVRVPVGDATTPTVDMAAAGEQPKALLDVEQVKTELRNRIEAVAEFKPVADFQAAVARLNKSVSGEEKKFQAVAEISGADVGSLLSGLEAVPHVLEDEAKRFSEKLVSRMETAIETLKAEAESMAQQIEQKTTELRELNDKRASMVATRIKMEGELDKAKIDFKTAASTVETEYQDLANKFKQFLGTGQ
jgi:chromosome segregation ATPase